MSRKPKSESYIVPVVMNKSNENNKPEQSPGPSCSRAG